MRRPAVEIRIGLGSCGVASGGEEVRAALERAVQRVAARATVKTVGCNGMCHCEPMVEVVEPGGRSTLYGNVNAESAQLIVRLHLRPRWLPAWWHKMQISDRSLTVAAPIDETATPIRAATGVPPWGRERSPAASYLGKQKRIVLENCGEIDPLNIDDYLARAGYQALAKCRDVPPEEVIEAIAKTGLREIGRAARGGSGSIS